MHNEVVIAELECWIIVAIKLSSNPLERLADQNVIFMVCLIYYCFQLITIIVLCLDRLIRAVVIIIAISKNPDNFDRS